MPTETLDVSAEIAKLKAEAVAAHDARDLCQATINRRLANIEMQINELFRMMNQRLPLWATTLIGLMGAAIGYLVK